MHDFCVVGGGILGLATALEILRRQPGADLVLLEKEDRLAAHQTGHNSGVIHSGIYYRPGSLKARLCREGGQALRAFAADRGVAVRPFGKVIVATSPSELARMADLEHRGTANGVTVQRLDGRELSELEPAITGVGALLVEETAVIDYVQVANAMADEIGKLGGTVATGVRLQSIREQSDSVLVTTSGEQRLARQLVVCGGLQADRLARLSGVDGADRDFQIVPFRGEYFRLPAGRDDLISRLIYPVPDPAMPFLGIHLTRTVDGFVVVGPNAVLGRAREGYSRASFDVRDVVDYLRFGGMWRLAARNTGTGVRELRNSLFKRSYLAAVRRYCPDLTIEDLQPHPAGIRAQAVLRDGTLVDDFRFAVTPRSLHVCDAPSPAATSSMAIAAHIADRLSLPRRAS